MLRRLCFIFLFIPFMASAQYIPEQTGNSGIYKFLDELTIKGVISFNEVIRPISKVTISKLLNEAKVKEEQLNTRQKKELDYYLQAYALETRLLPKYVTSDSIKRDKVNFLKNPISISYSDTLFNVSIRPLAGGFLSVNDKATIQNRWWGATINGYIGKHFSFYTSLTDHWETEVLAAPTYITQQTGGKYKNAVDRTGGEYSTILGGVAYAWKWGYLGFVNDRPVWGNGYNGTNILSGHNTPFPQITLKLSPVKWFEFNYLHGWLNSEILDSSRSFRSGNDFKKVYYNKYIAANMYTFIPWKSLWLSVGNSIIYSHPHAYPGFLIPTLFFRSVDENYTNINNNSQMFFTVNFKYLKHLHLYSSIFAEDFRLSRVKQKDVYNVYSFKGGSQLNGWPLQNVNLTFEYTRTNPITYKHKMDVLTFTTNNYTMGHYLRENSEEIFANIEWKPIRGTSLYIQYLNARHCNEYTYITDEAAVRYPVLQDNIWHNTSFTAGLTYELFAGTMFKASVIFSNITSVDADGFTAQYYLDRFTPSFMQGKNMTLEGGFNINF